MTDRATFRRRACLTQLQLARKVGITAPRLCLWERGEIELSPEQVDKIAAVLHGCLSKAPAFVSTEDLACAIAPTAAVTMGAA
jgi:transcriptional regulator with XRE-family HTH domain